VIDTHADSDKLRSLSIDLDQNKVMISRLRGSDQEPDISEPTNCDGLGRIRHFGGATGPDWPNNPLPLGPAVAALPAQEQEPTVAQVFQNASCNWRCWYCYVPFNLLAAHPSRSEWRTAGELVDLWQAEATPAPILDLSGGQPDLVPEWVVWTMKALLERGLENLTYLWSDDNLSTDYLWRFLSDADLELLGAYPSYGRAICFKGFDSESFAFNTGADPRLFGQQFELAGRLIDLGIDTYAYATITNDSEDANISSHMNAFVDQLQEIHELLPLRTIPLEIAVFGPVVPRMRSSHQRALRKQQLAVQAWTSTVEERFSSHIRSTPIHEISFTSNR
jgi:uncharacterized Fe-S cluster-containing radical SAM superfamily protein